MKKQYMEVFFCKIIAKRFATSAVGPFYQISMSNDLKYAISVSCKDRWFFEIFQLVVF
jgi:hypothetical protein